MKNNERSNEPFSIHFTVIFKLRTKVTSIANLAHPNIYWSQYKA